MAPSDDTPDLDLPPSLAGHCGPVRRHRCLSSRNQREVHLVEDGAGRRRILKIVRGLRPSALERFLRIHRQLQETPSHPGLMPILALGADGNVAWTEFPVADPVDTAAVDIESYSPLEPDRGRTSEGVVSTAWVASIGLGVVDALLHLQSKGLSHGDIKPGNLLRLGGRWVLSDFDTVGADERGEANTPSTEGYRPPGEETGPGRDCYAVGKLLYELWTGLGRLEYPTLPRHLLTGPRWSRRDQLLNETVHALCSPFGTGRFRDLKILRGILGILSDPENPGLSQVERLLRGRRGLRSQISWAVAVFALFGAGFLVSWFGRPNRDAVMEIGGESIGWIPYHHLQGINEGYVHQASDGVQTGYLLFNVHGTVVQPLRTGDQVEVDLKKDVWRGHVGVYLSNKPFAQRQDPLSFGHRERFGGLDHLLWFHLDGDSLVAPTAVEGGRDRSLDPGNWSLQAPTNTLASYHLELRVDADRFRWTISTGSNVVAVGSHPRRLDLRFLGFYAYDNTLCYLTRVRRHRPGGGSGASGSQDPIRP